MSRRKKYVPDLREMQSLAQRNYLAAASLLTEGFEVGDTRVLQLNEQLSYSVRVLTDAPYTTDLQIDQCGEGPDYLQTRFILRLYHDVRLAEIIESQGLERFAASYEQPNPKMHQRDEKRQINHFLADWLKLCFASGRWHDNYLNMGATPVELQVKR